VELKVVGERERLSCNGGEAICEAGAGKQGKSEGLATIMAQHTDLLMYYN